jgi:hypothetical protein
MAMLGMAARRVIAYGRDRNGIGGWDALAIRRPHWILLRAIRSKMCAHSQALFGHDRQIESVSTAPYFLKGPLCSVSVKID